MASYRTGIVEVPLPLSGAGFPLMQADLLTLLENGISTGRMDESPVSIDDSSLAWLELPSQAFVEYVHQRDVLPFDGVPPLPSDYRRAPTYMLTQMHRLWVTTERVCRYLGKSDVLVDFGAFPFSQDILLREFFGHRGPIHATMNLPCQETWHSVLQERGITPIELNLDPYVRGDIEGRVLPDRTSLPDESVDVAILAHVIEHLYHPLQLLKEAHRVLRRGGTILLSTDNAFMLDALLRFHCRADFLHEPVTQTAAMTFDFWRGHNRLFSRGDLATLLERAGFTVVEASFLEVLYNSFSDDYFLCPVRSLPRWRAGVLTRFPDYRNEVVLIAKRT